MQGALQSRTLAQQRHHLRQVARRACASHQRALCASTRVKLARIDAQTSRFRATRTPSHRNPPTKTPPAKTGSSGSTSSGSGSSGGGATSSGSDASGSGSGTTTSGTGSSASGTGSGTSTGGSNPITTPPTETGSIAESPSSTSNFQPGLNSGSNMTLDVQGAALLGAKVVRIAFEVDTPAAEMETVIAGYAAKGIRVLPLVSFYGTLPTPAEARSLANWAKAYGPGGSFWAGRSDGQLAIQSIEFGNETSYGYQYNDNAGERSYQERAENYARRLQEAAEAISATGIHVGLLGQDDDWTGDWMNGMYAAVPNLSQYVAGWTIHPYHNWRSRLEAMVEQLEAHHVPRTVPIDVTEFGLTTDNGNCLGEVEGYDNCMAYSEAASILKGTVSEMRQLLGDRLGLFMLYQVRDQRSTGTSTDDEYFYGALQHELQPKGAYTTAVESLLASS